MRDLPGAFEGDRLRLHHLAGRQRAAGQRPRVRRAHRRQGPCRPRLRHGRRVRARAPRAPADREGSMSEENQAQGGRAPGGRASDRAGARVGRPDRLRARLLAVAPRRPALPRVGRPRASSAASSAACWPGPPSSPCGASSSRPRSRPPAAVAGAAGAAARLMTPVEPDRPGRGPAQARSSAPLPVERTHRPAQRDPERDANASASAAGASQDEPPATGTSTCAPSAASRALWTLLKFPSGGAINKTT